MQISAIDCLGLALNMFILQHFVPNINDIFMQIFIKHYTPNLGINTIFAVKLHNYCQDVSAVPGEFEGV